MARERKMTPLLATGVSNSFCDTITKYFYGTEKGLVGGGPRQPTACHLVLRLMCSENLEILGSIRKLETLWELL